MLTQIDAYGKVPYPIHVTMTHNQARLRATFPSPGFCVPLDSPTDRNPPSATGCQALPTGAVLLGRDVGEPAALTHNYKSFNALTNNH